MRTKLMATLNHQAYRFPERLKQLLHSDIDAVRINTAYGTDADVRSTLEFVRRKSTAAIVIDTKGRQVRLIGQGRYALRPGDHFTLSDRHGPLVPTLPISPHLKPGDVVGLRLGGEFGTALAVRSRIPTIELEWRGPEETTIAMGTIVEFTTPVLEHPPITRRDARMLCLAKRWGVEYVALSFVHSWDDLEQLRQLCGRLKMAHSPRLIAKVEDELGLQFMTRLGTRSIEERREMMIMVARGDLSTQLPIYRLASIQHQILSECHQLSVESVVATGLMPSLQDAKTPRISEVGDVANTLHDHPDWVMLGAETAGSPWPHLAVEYFRRIEAELSKPPF